MKKLFSTTKKRIVIDTIPFIEEEFLKLMIKKPKEIFHGEWSDKKAFIVINEYNEKGILFYCDGEADKTPKQKTISELYDFLKYQGLEYCYIND